ncbi:helix-turn-helix domain-containing protein [Paenibacillus sp. L3-i20]|uniref:helix-turn-helix domain-containing protein n=1 Tax=Paenibacillus sp. L3-i20 TaxID=2905833 RepID=UPI001EDE41FC|nr:helix-turn-helix domain-containing protein [Paenibacillus sp. L3-i20]GKU80151.1 hypothetical protein L3i20_v245480 [Paenibacillus sp. L3-i20]
MSEIKGYESDTYEVSDIQRKLGIGINQAYKLAHSGEFHIVRIGKKIKIPRESFDNWFNGPRQGQ